jgi:hypothetical protein
MDPHEILNNGRKALDAVLVGRGFAYKETEGGRSSGGQYASGRYVKGDRYLEIHFRHSLGLVRYHIGELSLSHEDYMRALVGPNGGNKYPGFPNDPIDAFGDLAYDIQMFCQDFLSGPGEEFARCAKIAKVSENRSGFSRMAEFES